MATQVDPATLPGKAKMNHAATAAPGAPATPAASAAPALSAALGEASDRLTASAVTLVRTKGHTLTAEEREQFIRTAAYHLAESRNFEPGHAEEDWTLAVAQIDAALKSAEG